MYLTTEIVFDYKRGDFKLVISPPEFITDFVYLMSILFHSEVQKKNVEAFN